MPAILITLNPVKADAVFHAWPKHKIRHADMNVQAMKLIYNPHS